MMMKESKKRVLIVDNDEDVLGTLQQLLENAGFDTRTTWSGFEALDLLKTEDFQVLLVDDYLPDLHSSDFLSRVASLPIQPWVVVMQSSLATNRDVHHYASLGAVTVVRKHQLSEVCNAVSSCCSDEPLAKLWVN
jgi:two-component system nitrogen regulation response regulator NtrX